MSTKAIECDNYAVCKQNDCLFKKSCANHASAGDFRAEDGISPRLSLKQGVLHCETYYAPINREYSYDTIPIDHLCSGFVEMKSIREVVNTFDI